MRGSRNRAGIGLRSHPAAGRTQERFRYAPLMLPRYARQQHTLTAAGGKPLLSASRRRFPGCSTPVLRKGCCRFIPGCICPLTPLCCNVISCCTCPLTPPRKSFGSCFEFCRHKFPNNFFVRRMRLVNYFAYLCSLFSKRGFGSVAQLDRATAF